MANSPLINQNQGDSQGNKDGLLELQQAFGLFRSGGEFYVIDLQQVADVKAGKGGCVEFYKKQNGDLLLRRFLEDKGIPSDPKKVISEFLVNPKTVVFTEIAFSPLKTIPSVLNYWIGPTAKPVAGKCEVIKLFILLVICSGSEIVYFYLLAYLAHMIQKPSEKSGVMIVLLGGQGTGKGTFFRLLRAIWRCTTLQVSDINEIIGQFNAALEHNFVICMDEAIFSGDRKAQDKLKSMITEPKCRIEQKYQPSRTIDSYHRFFAASNHDHFAHVDQDDRRFLFLRVSDSAKGDHEYFSTLSSALADPSIINAFVHELMTMDISQFNVRNKPYTDEYANQKLRSLTGFSRYWFEVLTTGSVEVRGSSIKNWTEPLFVTTNSLVESYANLNKIAEWYRSIQETQLIAELKRLCPAVKSVRQKDKFQGQKRGWLLPSLNVARTEFAAYLGCPIFWLDETEADIGFAKETIDTYCIDNESHKTTCELLEDIVNNLHND